MAWSSLISLLFFVARVVAAILVEWWWPVPEPEEQADADLAGEEAP